MIALEILGLVGRESECKIVVISKLELGSFELRIRNSRALDGAMDLRPQLGSDLSLGGRSRKNNTFAAPATTELQSPE